MVLDKIIEYLLYKDPCRDRRYGEEMIILPSSHGFVFLNVLDPYFVSLTIEGENFNYSVFSNPDGVYFIETDNPSYKKAKFRYDPFGDQKYRATLLEESDILFNIKGLVLLGGHDDNVSSSRGLDFVFDDEKIELYLVNDVDTAKK